MAERKSPDETPMVVPSHGNGKLRVGGTNKGGPGRPKNSLRNLCHKRFQRHLPKLDKALKKDSLRDSDLISALNLFAKYGSEAAMPVPELRQRLQQQNAIIRTTLDSELAERVIQAIRGAWVAG